MKTLLIATFSALLLLTSATSFANPYRHKFTDLQIKDYDEMLSMVEKKVADSKAAAIKAQKEGMDEEGDKQAVKILRDALEVVFSRPDKDNMVAKLFPHIKKELAMFDEFESSIAAIVVKAVHAIQNENLSVAQRSTAVYVVENALAEIKPLVAGNEKLKSVVRGVRDAKIKVSEKVKNHRKLTSMDATPDLSKIATTIYAQAEKEEKAKKASAPAQSETSEEVE